MNEVCGGRRPPIACSTPLLLDTAPRPSAYLAIWEHVQGPTHNDTHSALLWSGAAGRRTELYIGCLDACSTRFLRCPPSRGAWRQCISQTRGRVQDVRSPLCHTSSFSQFPNAARSIQAVLAFLCHIKPLKSYILPAPHHFPSSPRTSVLSDDPETTSRMSVNFKQSSSQCHSAETLPHAAPVCEGGYTTLYPAILM